MKEKKTEKMLNYANGPSLEEINNTVEVPKNASFWRTLLAYSGPGALVAVGYMIQEIGLRQLLAERNISTRYLV